MDHEQFFATWLNGCIDRLVAECENELRGKLNGNMNLALVLAGLKVALVNANELCDILDADE